MKHLLISLLSLGLLFASCSSSGNSSNDKDDSNPIISIDSSEFNGRLIVSCYDFATNAKLRNSDVYLFINYEDIARGLWLNLLRTSGSADEADFGYLLQGNYYLVAVNGFKRDTSLVQILGRRTVRKDLSLR